MGGASYQEKAPTNVVVTEEAMAGLLQQEEE